MGIVARRVRVHLDANVVVGLVTDDVARNYVLEMRRNGADVFLSPTIASELAEAPLARRRQLVAAAIEHCDGITRVKCEHMLALEIEGINEGTLIPTIPVLPIAVFRRALENEKPWLIGRDDPKQAKAEFIEALETCNRIIRGHDLEPNFAAFLKVASWPIFKTCVLDASGGALAKPRLRPSQFRVHHDKHALQGFTTMIAANIYRKATGTMRKGQGCMSDLRSVAEAAQSDLLLTRDWEFYECGRLVRSALPDTRPEIRLVPQLQ